MIFVMPFPTATLEERHGADPFAIGHHHVAAALWAVGIEQAPIVWVSDPVRLRFGPWLLRVFVTSAKLSRWIHPEWKRSLRGRHMLVAQVKGE